MQQMRPNLHFWWSSPLRGAFTTLYIFICLSVSPNLSYCSGGQPPEHCSQPPHCSTLWSHFLRGNFLYVCTVASGRCFHCDGYFNFGEPGEEDWGKVFMNVID